MTQKNQMFAFVVGEVSPAVYGRLDLQKYSLGLAEGENFYVDYHGGLLNRSGTEFIAMFAEQEHQFVKFRAQLYDLTLFFTENKMRVLREGSFILSAAEVSASIVSGTITATNTFAPGDLVRIEGTPVSGYFSVAASSGSDFSITSPIGQVVPDGTITWAPVYELATPFTVADVAKLKFTQDAASIVCTRNTRLPYFIKRTADDNWMGSVFSNALPAAPTSLVGTPSAAGAASVGFAVTAVVDGVESESSIVLVTTSSVNYSTTTGYFTLSWAAVTGAERYNVYRSLIYPTAYPTGAQLSYLGYTTGLTFVDQNITSDGTKTIPEGVDFFSGGNYPAVYARFQQRGVYAGLANEPLTIIGSIANDKGVFSIAFPPLATDSYAYTLDSESERPIKHMLALRFGLMLFTDDGITQLRGGETTALSATQALAEPQSYVSVSDLSPVALNMDVLFMTSLNSEFNQLVYTEYTNSFKAQDILVLSTHLFSQDNKAVAISWAPEPSKLLHFVREDGQRVVLTYERNLEVYGWMRYRTKGDYINLIVVSEDEHNLTYQTVRRTIQDTSVMFLEREKPRNDETYDRMWFVDAGLARPLLHPNYTVTLTREGEGEAADWKLFCSTFIWASVDDVIYIASGIFRVVTVGASYLTLALMRQPRVSKYYQKDRVRVLAGDWGVNNPVTQMSGLWWLEGETVSVQSDGDATTEAVITNGELTIDNDAAFIVVGLGYKARAKTLPLTIPNYAIGGFTLNLRSAAVRFLKSKGLAVGAGYDTLEELPARSTEAWDNPLEPSSDFSLTELWGSNDWELDAQICFEQQYPLPAGIIGFSFDLDVGE